MIARFLSAVAFAGLAYALPLVGTSILAHDVRPWLAMTSALCLVFAQPTLSKEEARATRVHDRGSAPLIMACSLASQIAATLELRAATGVSAASAAAVGCGVALVLLGSGIRVAAIDTLGKAFTASVRVDAEHRLVERGIYRRIRHPSYLGALLALVGVPVVFSAWWAAGFTVVIMSAAYARRIRLEEGALVERHGDVYREYRGRTSGLVPGVW